MFKPVVLLAAIASVASAALPFKIGTPTLLGSGCPAGSVRIVPASDGQTLSVLFSKYNAATSSSTTRDRKSCNLAVNLNVNPGVSVAVTKVDYRGNVYVPKVTNASAEFSAEYFFPGQRGPTVSETYGPGTDKDIFLSTTATSLVYSGCGAATNFRINTAATAYRPTGASGDVQIAIDTADAVTHGFYYSFTTKAC